MCVGKNGVLSLFGPMSGDTAPGRTELLTHVSFVGDQVLRMSISWDLNVVSHAQLMVRAKAHIDTAT